MFAIHCVLATNIPRIPVPLYFEASQQKKLPYFFQLNTGEDA